MFTKLKPLFEPILNILTKPFLKISPMFFSFLAFLVPAGAWWWVRRVWTVSDSNRTRGTRWRCQSAIWHCEFKNLSCWNPRWNFHMNISTMNHSCHSLPTISTWWDDSRESLRKSGGNEKKNTKLDINITSVFEVPGAPFPILYNNFNLLWDLLKR